MIDDAMGGLRSLEIFYNLSLFHFLAFFPIELKIFLSFLVKRVGDHWRQIEVIATES